MTATSSLLESALEQLRLEGAIFFRSELADPFAIDSAPSKIADKIHPGAERVLLFHIVARGRCWVTSDDGTRHAAHEGDVIVLPYGDHHTLAGESPAECVPVLTLLDPPPWASIPVVEHGGDGPMTSLVCGYLVSDDPLFDPKMGVFPPAFVVSLPDRSSARWVEASVQYAMQEAVSGSTDAPGTSRAIATRLPELVVIEVLKAHLAASPVVEGGWLAALRDPVLAPALAMLHQEPERRWTVSEIAAGAAVSRSVLDERFRQQLGRSPIRYLAEWRMHLAQGLLATTDTTVFAIARRVGYDSEEAFSRAFKRARGSSPSHWRTAHRSA
jgi:AraC-like DNA-binding protein